jgi:tetratricopeptide (TPR) repeat protein
VTVYRSNDEHTYLDGGSPALLDSLPEDRARALLHILDCPTCQDAALAQAFEAVESRDEEKPPIRKEVDSLLAELLAVPEDQRVEVLKDPRFQRMELLDRVLDETAAASGVDLDLATHLAALAVWLGTKTDFDDPGLRPRLVRAYCLKANALRLVGKLDRADKELDNASCFLSGAPEEMGLYSRMLALLRWEQGRLHDAAALLRYGAQAYGELKRRHDQGVCLTLLGLAYVEAGEMKRAPAPLLRGLMSLDDSEAALASLDLAALYAETGRVKEIGRLATELEEAGDEPWATRLGVDALRSYVESKPSRGKAFEKAAVLSGSLRRTLRLGHPGLQTLPWT